MNESQNSKMIETYDLSLCDVLPIIYSFFFKFKNRFFLSFFLNNSSIFQGF